MHHRALLSPQLHQQDAIDVIHRSSLFERPEDGDVASTIWWMFFLPLSAILNKHEDEMCQACPTRFLGKRRIVPRSCAFVCAGREEQGAPIVMEQASVKEEHTSG
jgi:hypothetical protein